MLVHHHHNNNNNNNKYYSTYKIRQIFSIHFFVICLSSFKFKLKYKDCISFSISKTHKTNQFIIHPSFTTNIKSNTAIKVEVAGCTNNI